MAAYITPTTELERDLISQLIKDSCAAQTAADRKVEYAVTGESVNDDGLLEGIIYLHAADFNLVDHFSAPHVRCRYGLIRLTNGDLAVEWQTEQESNRLGLGPVLV